MDETRRPSRSIARIVFRAAFAVFALAFVGVFAFAQGGAKMIPIGQMEIGTAPADFEFARTGQGGVGQWTVVADATAEGGRAIAQTSADTTDYRFPLAIYSPFSAADVDVSVRFKSVAGRIDQAGGVAVRLVDSGNYYVVRANALEDNVRFYRVVAGRREELKGSNLRVTGNEWHTLRLKAQRDLFTVAFDDKELFTATDRALPAAGKTALWTKADSITRFDRIEIRTLP